MRSPGPVVCFGELMLRLGPPDQEALLQSALLTARFGGAEANVAVSLARLGTPAAFASVLPDNRLGRAAEDELRRHGVDVRALVFVPGRLGLYFVTPGAVLRPSEVLYDRAGSAFAEADPATIDWDAVLDGAARLHVSGVTPAIGPGCAAAAQRAVEHANRLGVPVSFDGNYRAKLWAAWDGDGPAILRGLLNGAETAFVEDRDIALILGAGFDQPDPMERRAAAAQAAFETFPRLRRMASTFRVHESVQEQSLSAVMFRRGSAPVQTREFAMSGIVDRIGGGDAFAAGLLHALHQGRDDQAALDFALAATVWKHSIPGDFNLATEADVESLLGDGGMDVKR